MATKSLTLANYEDVADTKDSAVTFTSGDCADANASSWTSVNPLETGETHASLFNKISTMLKNIRYLYKKLGTTDISSIGDGTVTDAISKLNSKILSGTISANGQLSFKLTNFAVFIGFYSSGQNAIFGFRNGAAAEIVKNGSVLTATVTGNDVTISSTSSGGIRYFLLNN